MKVLKDRSGSKYTLTRTMMLEQRGSQQAVSRHELLSAFLSRIHSKNGGYATAQTNVYSHQYKTVRGIFFMDNGRVNIGCRHFNAREGRMITRWLEYGIWKGGS